MKKIPGTGTGFAYLSRGPLVSKIDNSTTTQFDAVLRALQQRYVEERKLCLSVHPKIQDSQSKDELLVNFSGWKSAAKNAHVSYRTYVLDLSASMDELRTRLHQKWRRDLKLSEKRELSVDVGIGREFLERFDALFRQLQERKDFDPGRFLQGIHSVLNSNSEDIGYRVLIARRGSEDLAGVILSLHGDVAVYLLGASSKEGLATGASFLCQWRAVSLCKETNLKFYDLGGVDIEQNPGVELFKRRMGGTEIGVGKVHYFFPRGLSGLLTRAVKRLTGR